MLGRPGLASTPSLVTIMPVWWDLHQNSEEKLADSWTCGTSREGQASWWPSPHSILCPLHTWPANTCKCSRSSVTHLSKWEPQSSGAGWVNNLGLTTGLESGQRAASGNDLWLIAPGVISTKQVLEVNWRLRHPPGLCYWKKNVYLLAWCVWENCISGVSSALCCVSGGGEIESWGWFFLSVSRVNETRQHTPMLEQPRGSLSIQL